MCFAHGVFLFHTHITPSLKCMLSSSVIVKFFNFSSQLHAPFWFKISKNRIIHHPYLHSLSCPQPTVTNVRRLFYPNRYTLSSILIPKFEFNRFWKFFRKIDSLIILKETHVRYVNYSFTTPHSIPLSVWF